MKKYLPVMVIVALVLWAGVAIAADADGMRMIYDFIRSPDSKALEKRTAPDARIPDVIHITIASKENRAEHDNFDWRYDLHFVTATYNEQNPWAAYLTIVIKEYQEFVSGDNRGFVIWIFVDMDMDGFLDSWSRDYTIVGRDNLIVMPQYPEGLLNREWFDPAQKEAQARFEREINYWLGQVKRGI